MSRSVDVVVPPDSPAHPSSAASPLKGGGRGLVLILGALTALGPLAIDMYLPALPDIGQEMGGAAELTLSMFMIGMAAGQAFYGPIADRWGRRGPLLIGMAVFVAASIGCALAHSLHSLLLWRLVMALGGAASMVLPRAVVRDLYEEKDSVRVYSLLMLILGVSPILAPTLGGQMLGVTGWRGIFWVLAGIGLACTAAIWWGLPESLPRAQRSKGGVGLALRNYGELLRDIPFLGTVIAAGCTLGALFSYLTASPFVFVKLYHLTPSQYAMVFGFNALGLIGASQLNTWLVERFTMWQVLVVAFTVNALAGLLLLAATVTGWGGLPVLIGLIFVSMSCAGIIFPNIGALAMGPFARMAGSASALLGVFQFGFGATSGALVGLAQNGTAVPMGVGLATCAVLGLVVLRTMAKR
jgi:DHA1 family bicyclomycin/chloramphenicol resistance-like MFS transporter